MLSAELFLQGLMEWEVNKEYTGGISLDENFEPKTTTMFLQGIHLYNYWKYLDVEKPNIPNRKYINSGLIVGKACMLKDALNGLYIMVIQMTNLDFQII